MSWLEEVVDTILGAAVRTEDDLPRRTQHVVTALVVGLALVAAIFIVAVRAGT